MGLLRRVFLVNAAVLAAATAALAFTPLTVSFPVALTEAVVLAVGLVVMLALNYVLLRRTLEPLRRLAAGMGELDPLRPGRRVEPVDTGSELGALAAAFNAMAARLEHERAETSRLLVSTQEAERRLIARELHDEVGQGLTAALLQLDAVTRQAPEALRDEIVETRETVRVNLEMVRAIARRQRPAALEDLGLLAALRALAAEVSAARNGLSVQVRATGDFAAPDEAELAIYRIAQEALTNAVRHAGASDVLVELRHHEGVAALRVLDDGGGFGGDEGVGLRGMRERALLAGGTFDVRAVAGGGTEVVAEIPVR